MARVLDLTIMCQESGSPYSLTDEHILAGTLRAVEQNTLGEAAALPPSSGWEAGVRFRMLQGFHDNWIAYGEYESLEEAISAAIDSEHPFCGEFLAPVASEAQDALVHMLDSADSRALLARALPWATPEMVTTLLDSVNGHMRHEHPVPSPTPDGRRGPG
ncbi:hypothetical protein [Streptomyces diastatochromogenes]|uniref:hypothetical protein n=1 Tax=Streptomyces diastatochromogenes TaxID=42236 RepID=UPI0036A87C49